MPTGTSRGRIRAAGQAKASTASTIIIGSTTDTISSCRHGGCAARGFARSHLQTRMFVLFKFQPAPTGRNVKTNVRFLM